MKHFAFIFLFFSASILAVAQTPDWATGIAPILYKNCAKCHNSAGVAPFSLLTYTDAYNFRQSMLTSVVNKVMPPWSPDPNYRHFAQERILSDADINSIRSWVTAGAPKGDLAKAPPAPVYQAGSQIVDPDLVLTIPTYSINTTTDLYRCFAFSPKIPADHFISQIEVVPGDRSVVHHALVFKDLSSTPLQLQAANKDGAAGYTNFGGSGSNSSKLLMGYVPGQGVQASPDGMGLSLEANNNIVIQIHYPGGITNKKDSTKIFMKFSKRTDLRNVYIEPILNHLTSALTNGPLTIPAGKTKQFNEKFKLPAFDITALSVAPHMHLIGRRIKSYVVTPVGDTIPLVNVPSWDFHWQGAYNFRKPIKIPAGSTLYADAFYDNTTANPANPNFPLKDVSAGENTTDEMMIVYFTFLLYQPGDENIVVDSSAVVTATNDLPVAKQKLAVQLFPNPADQRTTLSFNLPQADEVTTDIFNLNGELVKPIGRNQSFPAGQNNIFIETHDLPPGAYLVRISSGKIYGVEKMVKID